MPRAKAYNRLGLLETVTEQFWQQGYEQTSIGRLVAGSKVNRASLYAAYPDKKHLFLSAVKHYLATRSRDKLMRLKREQPAAEAIRRFFFDLLAESDGKQGCLVTNTAVEFGVSDDEVARLVRSAIRRVESVLESRLQEIADAGELAAELSPRQYARQLTVHLQGIRVMMRAGFSRTLLREATESALWAIE